MQSNAEQIAIDIKSIRENLLKMSDDIWLSIDHNDQEAFEKGVAFKRKFTKTVAEFNAVTSELLLLIQDHFGNSSGRPSAHLFSLGVSDRDRSNDYNINFDGVKELSLDDSFTHTKPVSYVFREKVSAGVESWRELYLDVCRYLMVLDSVQFNTLIDSSVNRPRGGNPIFSRDSRIYIAPQDVDHGVFTEGNMSANSIRDRIKLLFELFRIETTDLSVRVNQF